MSKMNLAPREKRLIVIMFVVMIAIAVIPVYGNISTRHSSSREQLVQARTRLQEAQLLREEIVNAREGQRVIMEKLRARPGNFDLYGFTRQTLRQYKLEGRADLQSKSLSSSEGAFEGVQVTLRNVGMKDIIDFTHSLYASNNLITMQRLSNLSPSRDGKGMECSIVFIAPKR